MNMIPVLCRHRPTGFIEPVECPYSGDIKRKVWESLNRRFLTLHAANYFYPCEPLDAYQEAVAVLAEKGAAIRRGELVLEVSTPETYLTGVAYRHLYHFHNRKVAAMRAEYRRVEGTVVMAEESEWKAKRVNAPEGADVGGASYAAACVAGRPEPPRPMTAQQLAEALPGEPNANTRREEARFVLQEICARLPVAVVVAFRAYVAANGNMLEAAHLAHQSKTDFYRKWPGFLVLARKVAERGAYAN